MIFFLIFLPLVSACVGPISFDRFFSRFGLPADAQLVVGGYLPSTNDTWLCHTDKHTQNNTHGFFINIGTGTGDFVIGVSQKVFDPNKWQLYIYKPNNMNALAMRICKWPAPGDVGITLDSPSATECLFRDGDISFDVPTNRSVIIGLTWSDDSFTVFTDRITKFTLKNADWSVVRAICSNGDYCPMQFPRDVIYYMFNTTGGLQYSLCTSPDCRGFATNVFAVKQGGYIPDSFSFNNWFLLTNTSTLVNGRVLSSQPVLVECLIPVPNFLGTSNTFSFNGSLSDGCNGAHSSRTPEAFRFNINDTEALVAANSVVLTTVEGFDITLICSNSSDPIAASSFSIPFGAANTVYYCFLNVSYGDNYTIEFLSVLPPSVKEFVITKYGCLHQWLWLYSCW